MDANGVRETMRSNSFRTQCSEAEGNPLTKLKKLEAQLGEQLGGTSVASVVPEVALVLGSGLGALADAVEDATVVPYDSLDGFPVSTAPGHAGRFVFGTLAGVPVVVMQGRVHYYEGYPMEDVVLPVRLLARRGVKRFILTNAAGGMQKGMKPGDLMLITDHISSLIQSPLLGPNIDELGVRFPDMTQVYDLEMQDAIRTAARDLGIDLKEGVYIQISGPQFETPTEIRTYQGMGADATGMSTVVEAIALRHMGARVAGISCISNLASGLGDSLLTSEDVNETGAAVAETFTALLKEVVKGCLS